MKAERQEQDFDFPYGWNRGDTCVMITNKAKKSTCEYTVESYDGRYFGVRSHTGVFHRASPQRLFHTREEAVAALEKSETPTQERGGMTFQSKFQKQGARIYDCEIYEWYPIRRDRAGNAADL